MSYVGGYSFGYFECYVGWCVGFYYYVFVLFYFGVIQFCGGWCIVVYCGLFFKRVLY